MGLRDKTARVRVTGRIFRILHDGNFGDHRERISGAVSELRIDYGPGYRVYIHMSRECHRRVIGLCGTKERQQADIAAASGVVGGEQR